jgi:mRNA-degrading endonuclease toxin of MazEF toxin-antitoxin module
MVSKPPALRTPKRGEIWAAFLGGPGQQRHWVVIVSLDARNLSDRAQSVLIVPFSSSLVEGPTTLILPPGETGLPGPSCLRAHFITTIAKSQLIAREPRPLSDRRLRELCLRIRRSFDPDAPF